jgi:MraZ protein
MMFPAKLRKQLEEVLHHGLVINRHIFDNCLVLYPQPEWEIVKAEMARLSRYSQKHQLFQRKFMGGASQVEPDGTGRLLLPAMLLEYAQIDPKENNEVIVSGLGDKIEIWSVSNYRAKVIGDDIDFGALAEEVRKDIERPGGITGLN